MVKVEVGGAGLGGRKPGIEVCWKGDGGKGDDGNVDDGNGDDGIAGDGKGDVGNGLGVG